LARLLGTDGYGAYALAIAWIELLMLTATLGVESLMVREIARLQELQPERSRSYALWSTKTVVVTSVTTAVIGGGVIVVLQSSQAPDAVLVQIVALLLLPLWALTRIGQGILRGVGRIYSGQVPESLLVPVIILGSVGLISLTAVDLTPAVAMSLRLAGVAVALAAIAVIMWRSLPPGKVIRLPKVESRGLIRSALALVLISTIFLVATRTDIVMLGALADLDAVGSYTVASRGAGFLVFPFAALNIVLAPAIASLYAAGNRRQLQSVLTWGARFAFLAALPIALGLVVFGSLFLDVFGEGFGIGLEPLRILTVGSLVASAAGSTGLIMTMTGHETSAAKVVGLAAVVNIVLNLLLIPPFGSVGAAWATVISTNLWTIMLAWWVRRNLRIDPSIVGRPPTANS
ncbi:MAG: flippase, partial [Acidimicrobiia bacterium]|nr:flippase [Acidimicrobiia bacterium]